MLWFWAGAMAAPFLHCEWRRECPLYSKRSIMKQKFRDIRKHWRLKWMDVLVWVNRSRIRLCRFYEDTFDFFTWWTNISNTKSRGDGHYFPVFLLYLTLISYSNHWLPCSNDVVPMEQYESLGPSLRIFRSFVHRRSRTICVALFRRRQYAFQFVHTSILT